MKRILTHKDFVNEKIFQDQYEDTINLKPGDVIYAKENFTNDDIDYSKMSKSKLGQIKQLNARNMMKGAEDYRTYNDTIDYNWDEAKKGDVLAVVMTSGNLAFKSNWSSNIKDRDDTIQIAYNILFNEGKIGIREYDKDNDEERKIVFKNNLRWTYREEWIVYLDKKIEFKSNYESYRYDMKTDDLIIKIGYETGSGKSTHMRVKNASEKEFINNTGKELKFLYDF